MIKLYLFSKAVHRYLVIIMTVIALVMAGTGTVLKYKFLGDKLGLNIGMISFIHGSFSVLFTIILFLMIVSGIIMYIFPLVKNK